MSNIDEIFKKGLDGKGVEYSESHWSSMEKMLNANKIGFFARFKWTLSVSALLLLCVAIYVLWPNLSSKQTVAHTPSQTTDQTSNNANLYAHDQNILESTNNTDEITALNDQPEGALDEDSDILLSVDDVENQHSPEIITTISTGDPLGDRISFNDPMTTSVGNIQSDAESSSDAGVVSEEMPSKPLTGSVNRASFEDHTVDNLNPIGLSSIPLGNLSNMGTQIKLKELYPKRYGFYVYPFISSVDYDRSQMRVNARTEGSGDFYDKPIQSQAFGIHVGVRRNKMQVTSGIEFITLKEQTDYWDFEKVWDYTVTRTLVKRNYTKTPRGANVALITEETDSSFTVNPVKHCENCEATFQYLSVPLNFQYELGKRRLGYFIEAGGSVSFLRKASGSYVVLDGDDRSNWRVIRDMESLDFLNSTMFYGGGALGVKYKVTGDLSLWTSYGYRKGFTSIFKDFEQTPTLKMLNIGVGYKLR